MAIPPPRGAGLRTSHPRVEPDEPGPKLPKVTLAQMGEITANVLALLPGAQEVAYGEEADEYWEPIGDLESAKGEAEGARKYWDHLAAKTKHLKEGKVTRPRSIEVVECPHCRSFWVVVSGRSRAYPGGEKYGCRNLGNKGNRCPGVANVVRARY